MSLTRRGFLKNSGLITSAVGASSLLSACSNTTNNIHNSANSKVAILSDVHFHDVYGDYAFKDKCPKDSKGRNVTMRSMNVSCRSTRMFNENYFVLKAALDDLGRQKVKYICFSGDYSDDGQLQTLMGLKNVLIEYKDKYGFEYFLTPGNHDQFPHNQQFSKIFLNDEFAQLKVYSDDSKLNSGDEGQHGHSVYKDPEMQGVTPEQSMQILAKFGYSKQAHWVYYETPFSNGEDCDKVENRYYTAHNSSKDISDRYIDSSYLVEPEEGLWLCMIDQNSFYPKSSTVSTQSKGAWGNCISDTYGKGYLIDWIKSVSQRAEKFGKRVIFISHYPALNYLNGDGVSDPDHDPSTYDGHDFAYLLGDTSNTIKRLPKTSTGEVLAKAGVKLHFAGHMHINDTYQLSFGDNTITNIQIPSLSAYIPAYKLVSFKTDSIVEIDTVVVEDVPDYNALFPFYHYEIEYLVAEGRPISNKETESFSPFWGDMLEATSYRDLMRRHLMTLVRHRFFDSMSDDMKEMLSDDASLYILMVASKLPAEKAAEAVKKSKLISSNNSSLDISQILNVDQAVIDDVNQHIAASGLMRGKFFDETFDDLLDLTYHLKNADELSLDDFGFARIPVYQVAMELISQLTLPQLAVGEGINESELLKARLAAMGRVFNLFIKAHPSKHFTLDLQSGVITDLWGKNPLRA